MPTPSYSLERKGFSRSCGRVLPTALLRKIAEPKVVEALELDLSSKSCLQGDASGIYNRPPSRLSACTSIHPRSLLRISGHIGSGDGRDNDPSDANVRANPKGGPSFLDTVSGVPVLGALKREPRNYARSFGSNSNCPTGGLGYETNSLYAIRTSLFDHHRHALAYDLNILEIESRVEIISDCTIEVYALLMKMVCERWNLLSINLCECTSILEWVSKTIDSLLDAFTLVDRTLLFTEYDTTGIRAPSKPFTGIHWGFRSQMLSLHGDREKLRYDITNSTRVKRQRGICSDRLRHGELTMCLHLMDRIIVRARYPGLENVFSDRKPISPVNASPTVGEEMSRKSAICWGSFLGSLHTVWVSSLGVEDIFINPKFDIILELCGTINEYSAYRNSVSVKSRRTKYPPRMADSTSTPIRCCGRNSMYAASEGDLTVSFDCEDISYADSSGADAPLMYYSFFLAGERISISPIPSVEKPLESACIRTLEYCMKSNYISLLGVPLSRSSYTICTGIREKSLVLLTRLEYQMRQRILFVELARFECILRGLHRMVPWMSNLAESFMRTDVFKHLQCSVHQRNLVAQIVEEKRIAAEQCENQLRLMFVFFDVLNVVSVEEQSRVRFFSFVAREQCAFLMAPSL